MALHSWSESDELAPFGAAAPSSVEGMGVGLWLLLPSAPTAAMLSSSSSPRALFVSLLCDVDLRMRVFGGCPQSALVNAKSIENSKTLI